MEEIKEKSEKYAEYFGKCYRGFKELRNDEKNSIIRDFVIELPKTRYKSLIIGIAINIFIFIISIIIRNVLIGIISILLVFVLIHHLNYLRKQRLYYYNLLKED